LIISRVYLITVCLSALLLVSEQKGLNKRPLLAIAVNVSTTKAHVVFQRQLLITVVASYFKPAVIINLVTSTVTDFPTHVLMLKRPLMCLFKKRHEWRKTS